MHPQRPVASAVAVLVLALACSGQATHKDTRLGFSFKPPKGFEAIAIEPGDRITVAKYQDGQTDYAGEGYSLNKLLRLQFWPTDGGAAGAQEFVGAWVERLMGTTYAEYECARNKPIKAGRIDGTELHFVSEEEPVAFYCAALVQEDGVFVFEGSALAPRFDKAAGDYASAVKSFRRIEREDTSVRKAELAQLDDQERFLQEQIDKLPPGWSHMRTRRYLFLFDADKAFVKQMGDQIEALRDEYERLYPPSEPIQAVSIVRVCKNEDGYRGYGGPPGSGGYWASRQRELVFFDQAPRDETLCVLNHEAFHQYIYYFYGELAPHSWYNEGHGDYFSGARLTRTYRITGYGNAPGGFNRAELAKEMLVLRKQGKPVAEGALAPLREFLDYSQEQYYDRGPQRPVGFYPQGWAFVHMLRESRSLPPRAGTILPRYLESLLAARTELATGLMEKARAAAEKEEAGSAAEMSADPSDWYDEVDEEACQHLAFRKAFGDWTEADWDALEKAFLAWVEKL